MSQPTVRLVEPDHATQQRAAAEGWPVEALEPYYDTFTLAGGASSTARGGVPIAAVRVVFSHRCDRKPHPTSDATAIDAIWEAKLATTQARGGRLFNATKFRLHSIQWADDGARDGVVIELGLTCYKDYVGTNLLPDAERLALEAAGGSADPNAHLSNALGCETVLLTSDGLVTMLRRSGAVATGTGLYNGPSGHPEPSHAGIEGHASNESDASVVTRLEELARAEIFRSVLLEVHEETNVPLAALSEPRLIGAMADRSRKPDLLFVTHTKLSANEVRAAYAAGAVEGWESDRLAFCSLGQQQEGQELAPNVGDLPLTAVTRAAIAALRFLDSNQGVGVIN